MRLEATSPFKGEDDPRQRGHHPQDSSEHQWGCTIPQASFCSEEERTNCLTPMVIMVIQLQDMSPWTRITPPWTSSFLKGRCRILDGDKMLASLGTTQRTVSSILSL